MSDTMTRRSATAFVALVLCFIALAPRALTAQDPPTWVQEVEGRWWNAIRTGDVRTLRSLFAADAVMVAHDRTVRGARSAEGFVMALYAAQRNDCEGRVDCDCQWSTEDTQVLDRLATVLSSGSCTATPRDGGEPRVRRLRFLKVYERQPDGTWLVVRASHQPSPPS